MVVLLHLRTDASVNIELMLKYLSLNAVDTRSRYEIEATSEGFSMVHDRLPAQVPQKLYVSGLLAIGPIRRLVWLDSVPRQSW